MAMLHAGTTPACSHQLTPSHWRNSVENTHLTPHLPTHKPKKGREGLGARIREIHFNSRSPKISMKCNTSHKISKGPCGHPKDHRRMSRRPLTSLAWNLTLPKLHFSHITLYLYKKYYLSRAWRGRQKTSWRRSSIGHGTTSLWLIVNIFPVREVSLLSVMFLVCKSSKVLPSSSFTTPLPFISWS